MATSPEFDDLPEGNDLIDGGPKDGAMKLAPKLEGA